MTGTGAQGDQGSTNGAPDGNGEVVVFTSTATNFDPNSPPGIEQVYVHDRTDDVTLLISVSTDDDAPANGTSYGPSVSADAQYVAFVSRATNLTADGSSGLSSVYIRDREIGRTTRIPTTSDAYGPQISADGRHVCFHTAEALDPNDTNGTFDVYVWDLDHDSARLASDPSRNVVSQSCAISADGAVVSFASARAPADGPNTWDIFASDFGASSLTSLTANVSGGADPFSAMSADGTHVAVAEFDEPDRSDVHVFTLRTGEDWLVSATLGYAIHPTISGDGLVVGFTGVYPTSPTLDQIFTVDAATHTLKLVSRSVSGGPGDDVSDSPVLSSDGSFVVFFSSASNLVMNDTNGASDTFIAPTR